ncbi:unnamed protein product [Didymodactylos carnosus]|nr:unnamed protein product [Didymodactylos carnosus]CAF4010279.1 unnamed protein product [Didymodactylos carnosus]
MALTKKQDTKLDLLVEQDLYQFNNLFKVLWNLSLIHKINGNYELAWDTYKQYLTSEAYVAHDCYLDMLIRETYALLVSTCPKQAEWDEQMMSKIKFIDASSLDADKYSDVIADAYKDIISEYLDKNKADLGKELLTKALDSLTGKSLEQLYAPLQYENIGDNYQEQNQFDLAAECYEKSLSLELESAHRNDSHQIRFDMRVFVKTLKCRTNSSNFQLAIDFSKKISADYINAGMTLHEVINLYTALVDFDQENNVTVNENDRIEWYNKLGEYNSKIGDVYKSNVWYKKILHHDDANIWANIAYNYNQINDYKLAIYHYKKALECSLKIRDRDLIACICFGLASSFSRLPNKKNVAIDHYKRALLFCTATEELSTFVDPNSVHNTVIAINRQTGDNFKSAAQFYTKTIHLCLKNKLNTHKEIASAHKAFYLAYGDKQTVEFYKAVIDIYEQQIRMVEDDLHDLLTIYKYLACIYEKNGNFQLAIDLFRKWQAHSKFIRHNDIEYGLLCFKIATLYDKLDEDSTAIEHYQEGLTLLRNGSNIPDASCLPVVCNIMDQF